MDCRNIIEGGRDMSFQYFKCIREILERVENEESIRIETASKWMSEAILNEKSIFIFGASHAGILTQEMYYRAGGLITINPIFGKEISLDNEPITITSRMERLEGYGTILAEKTSFQSGDVLFLHSVSGRNPVTIEMAIAARQKGVKIIAITNMTYSQSTSSRHSSGKMLYEVSDLVIDNHGVVGDAVCEIDGLNQKVSPSSTVVGATILNTIVAETCRILMSNGIVPPVYYSANLDGGDENNRMLLKKYEKNIHYRYL